MLYVYFPRQNSWWSGYFAASDYTPVLAKEYEAFDGWSNIYATAMLGNFLLLRLYLPFRDSRSFGYHEDECTHNML